MGYSGTSNLQAMTHAANYNAFLLSLIVAHASHGQTIVDLGAGIGTFAIRMREQGFQVLCVEPDEAQARAIAATGLAVMSEVAELEDDSVDFLYALNVMEHVEDDRAVLRKCRSKLRIGGQLLAYVPALQVLYSSMDRQVGHHRRYTRRSLSTTLTDAGFRVIESRYADCAGVPASLAFKVFGSKAGQVNVASLVTYDKYLFPLSRVGDRVFGRLLGKNAYALAIRMA